MRRMLCILLALLKLLSGVLSLSVFTCVNGLYTLGMVLARYCALVGVVRTQRPAERGSPHKGHTG